MHNGKNGLDMLEDKPEGNSWIGRVIWVVFLLLGLLLILEVYSGAILILLQGLFSK